MTDILDALRAYLLADDAVAALCESRVFAVELPQAQASTMPRSCVVITCAGGPEKRGTDRIVRGRFDAHSYGETHHLAGQLDRAMYDALRRVRATRVGEVLLYNVLPSAGPMPMRDTDEGWPVFVRSMTVAADEREIVDE